MPLWTDPLFEETASIIIGFILLTALITFPLKKRHIGFKAAWASIQSWLLAAPIIFLFMGFGGHWPLVFLTCVAILGAKEFFQITGTYHKVSFVWVVYLGIIGLAFCIQFNYQNLYDIMPMIVLGALLIVPILQNKFKNMIQYISLSLINFILLGWAFLHLAKLIQLERGVFAFLYIALLTELSDNIALACGRFFGKHKIVDKITSKRTVEGLALSFLGTAIIAYGMRHLLPIRSEVFWGFSALVVIFAGSLGDLVVSFIRRDLGLKEMGVFILGRGGVLGVVDRSVFVAPIFYYTLEYLLRNQS